MKKIYLVETNYKTHIMDPCKEWSPERFDFLRGVIKILPEDAKKWPVVSIGIDDGEEVVTYCPYVGEVERFSISGMGKEEKAGFLEGLLNGENAKKKMPGDDKTAGHLIDTTNNNTSTKGRFDGLYKLLEEKGYEIERFTVNKD